MKCPKIFTLLSILLSTSLAKANVFSDVRELHARGIMVAVDTRDHRHCQLTKKHVESIVRLDEDLCAFDGLNPLSVVVITIPVDEWDFMAEIDNSRRVEKSIRDKNTGFIRASRTSLLFLLPYERTSDNLMRVATRSHTATVSQVRVSDLSMIQEMNAGYTFIHFTMKHIPHEMTAKDRQAAEKIVQRVRIRSQEKVLEHKEKTVLDSLNIISTINSSINDATEGPNQYELNFFLPDAYCRREGQCHKTDDDSLIPLGLGFSFKIRF